MGESIEPTSIGEGGLKDLLWPPGLQTLSFVEWSLVAFEVRESCLLPGSFLPWKIRVPSLHFLRGGESGIGSGHVLVIGTSVPGFVGSA